MKDISPNSVLGFCIKVLEIIRVTFFFFFNVKLAVILKKKKIQKLMI